MKYAMSFVVVGADTKEELDRWSDKLFAMPEVKNVSIRYVDFNEDGSVKEPSLHELAKLNMETEDDARRHSQSGD